MCYTLFVDGMAINRMPNAEGRVYSFKKGGNMETGTKLPEIRLGEIAMLAYLAKKREEGITLRPKEIRRGILNEAKKHGVSAVEAALFAKFVLEKMYDESVKEIDSIIIGGSNLPDENGQG